MHLKIHNFDGILICKQSKLFDSGHFDTEWLTLILDDLNISDDA